MNIQVYRSFLTVVQCKCFTQAAKILNFTQPTISNHIASLEQTYGVTLFTREGRNVYLTAAGNAFVPIAKKLLSAYEDSLEEMTAFHEEGMLLKIAVSTQFINHYLIPILFRLKEEFPELEIIVDRRMTLPDAIEDTFARKKYDFAFAHMDVQPMYSKRLRLWQQKLVWVASRELFERHGGSGDIYDYPFVGYGSYDEYNNLLKDKVDFDRFGSVVSFNDSESVLACVRRHLGIAVAPYIKVRQDVESGGELCAL